MNPHTQLLAIRRDLTRVARESGLPDGYAPSWDKYRTHGRVSEFRLRKAAGGLRTTKSGRKVPAATWTETVRRLGFRPAVEARGFSRNAAVRDLMNVAARMGRDPGEAPTTEEYRVHGRYSITAVCQRLMGERSSRWVMAMREAGLDCGRAVERGEVTQARMIEDYREVARELGMEPGGPGPCSREFEEAVDYSPDIARHRFGGWNALVEAAGFEPREPLFPATP